MTVKFNTQNSYDELPYQSYPYAQSTPENLKTLGVLFGMTPPAIETAKVLELGCAEGNNLIPHAALYPKAKFLGIDLSKVQIDAGKKHVETLGLKNIELRHCSITDIDESFGKFDYIICHGVISWVPEFVRDKIFEISNKNLSQNGIAYISYNTLPGWNMVRTIRDMMIYHTRGFDSPIEKVNQSRLLLDFVKDSLEGSETPYSEVLKTEAELLSQQTDHYLRHDHLEENNKQFYFNEFIQNAAKNDLQYLSDCSIPSMYVGNMSKTVVDKLQGLNDIIRTEQYMDFITNRRFRATLLCHKDVVLNRALNMNDAKKFCFSLNVTPEKLEKEADLNGTEIIKFFYNNNKDSFISAGAPGLKAVLYVFSEYVNNPLSFNEIVEKAANKLKSGYTKENIEVDMLNNLMNLVIKGYANISISSGNKDKVKLDKPKLSKLTIYQATNTPNNWVANFRHQAIAINNLDKVIIKYMDGTKTKEDILKALIEEVKSSKININKDGKSIEQEDEIKKELTAFLESTIEKFSNQALFV
jgi:methyltransferase-like protein/cyclopropane fatty-acyl-phospholipid synthase-like methyltransferase